MAAGDIINASDFDEVITKDTTVGTYETGFTAGTTSIRTSLFGKLVFFRLEAVSANTLTITGNGNLPDIACFTLDAAYWPDESIGTSFGSGVTGGEAQLGSNGVVLLRAASHSVAPGTLRMNWTYLRD